ncbi:hypothetical protein AOH328_02890 [Helicobacter pylori]
MSVNDLIKEGVSLFKSNNFDQAIAKFNQALDEIEDKNSQLEEQNNIQFWLGRCYLEQALKVRDITEAKGLFAQAIEHHQEQLKLAKHLTKEQTRIQEQIYAQSWLGLCYFEQARKVRDITEAKGVFAQAIEHHQEQLKLAKQLTDEQTGIQEQNNAQYWLGHCYFEQALKVRDITEAKRLFAQAIEHHQEQLKLAKHLTKEQTRIQEQIYAQSWLGLCYFEQARKVGDITEAKGLLTQAIEHLQEWLKLAEQLTEEQARIQEQINAQSWIDSCHRNISFLEKNWSSYWEKKKQDIRNALFSNMSKRLDKGFEDTVSTILAVLNIPPIELGSTPLAHYTSSTVCNKLFGVLNEDGSSPMRIGSSSYMNDPSEGKGLLELLALQDFELENKADCSPHNAFFACFSSRVNDLNQFRLYGKEDDVEASGCCLVFNKNGDWLKEPDISAPFRSFIKNQDENSATFKKADLSNVECENLPLYQVAYIAYKDDYITKEKCGIWLNDSKFGIRLKPIGENKDWHAFRIQKLENALKQLINFFQDKANVNDKNKNALEYIRYLFKDFAFRDEEEFRVLKMAKIGSEEIKYCEKTQSIYLPYTDISNMVDEVILGTNYEKTNSRRKAEVFQHEMKRKYLYVDVSRSSLPIYANPPIKKD